MTVTISLDDVLTFPILYVYSSQCCCYSVAILLIFCCYSVAILLLFCCYSVAVLWLFCGYSVAIPWRGLEYYLSLLPFSPVRKFDEVKS